MNYGKEVKNVLHHQKPNEKLHIIRLLIFFQIVEIGVLNAKLHKLFLDLTQILTQRPHKE